MKTVIFETLPAALLLGVEAFALGFGAVWLVLSSILPADIWIWPALGAGAAAAIASAVFLMRQALRWARREASEKP
jgi:hypothetical protein